MANSHHVHVTTTGNNAFLDVSRVIWGEKEWLQQKRRKGKGWDFRVGSTDSLAKQQNTLTKKAPSIIDDKIVPIIDKWPGVIQVISNDLI